MHWTKQLRSRVKSYQAIVDLLSYEECRCFKKVLTDPQAVEIIDNRMRAIRQEWVVCGAVVGYHRELEDKTG